MQLPTSAQMQAAFVAWFNSLFARPAAIPTNIPNRTITPAPDQTLADIQALLGITPAAAPTFYSFKALLTQTGTDAPTAAVLESTFPGLVAITRSSPGNYQVIFPQASNIDKIAVYMGSVDGAGDQGCQAQPVAENTVAIVTYVPSTLAQEDDILSKTLIHLQVYL